MTFLKNLGSFMEGFYGYGNFEAPYWFVGIEEAGEDTHSYIRTRVDRWAKQGGELVDLRLFNKIEWYEYFEGNHPKLQNTWHPLIRLLLNIQGFKPRHINSNRHQILRSYQATKLGGKNSETCLVELFPLPCSSNKNSHWIYTKYKKNFPFLATKSSYESHFKNYRIKILSDKIQKFNPKLVVFNGLTYINQWNFISGTNLSQKNINNNNFYISKIGNTTFVAINHSSTRLPNKYFDIIGTYLRRYYIQ